MSKFNLLTVLTLNASGYNKGIDSAKKSTQSLEKGTKAATRSITSGFKSLAGLGGEIGNSFGEIGMAVNGGTAAFKAMIPAINGVKTALISSGIGAIVVALGLAVASLTRYFKGTEEGQIVFKKVMNNIKAYVEPVLSMFGKFGKAIYQMFTGDFKGAWSTAKSAVNDVGGAIKENIETVKELNIEEEKYIKNKRAALLETKKLESDIEEFKTKSIDKEKYSAEQRQKYISIAIAKQNELAKIETNLANQELKIAKMKGSLGDNDIATNDELIRLEAARFDITKNQATKLKLMITTQRKINDEVTREIDLRQRALLVMENDKMGKGIKPLDATVKVGADVDTGGLNDMSGYIDNNTNKIAQWTNELNHANSAWGMIQNGMESSQWVMESMGTAINGITGAFEGLFSGAESGFKNMITSMLQGIGQLINALLAQAIAQMITTESKKGVIGLATAAIGVSILTGLWKSKVPEFANGGIVGGNLLTGDKITARVNSREMILNTAQQANLFALANGRGKYNGGGGDVTFRIEGTQLVGVLNNYNRKINSIR